jgi:hypothetical protein
MESELPMTLTESSQKCMRRTESCQNYCVRSQGMLTKQPSALSETVGSTKFCLPGVSRFLYNGVLDPARLVMFAYKPIRPITVEIRLSLLGSRFGAALLNCYAFWTFGAVGILLDESNKTGLEG